MFAADYKRLLRQLDSDSSSTNESNLSPIFTPRLIVEPDTGAVTVVESLVTTTSDDEASRQQPLQLSETVDLDKSFRPKKEAKKRRKQWSSAGKGIAPRRPRTPERSLRGQDSCPSGQGGLLFALVAFSVRSAKALVLPLLLVFKNLLGRSPSFLERLYVGLTRFELDLNRRVTHAFN